MKRHSHRRNIRLFAKEIHVTGKGTNRIDRLKAGICTGELRCLALIANWRPPGRRRRNIIDR
jgi:hypothetical protein